MLAGGHLLTMISNARKIAAYMASERTMKAHYPAMYRIMKLELEHLETLRLRDEFLNLYVARVTRDIYQERDEKLLPQFVRTSVEPIPVYGTDGDGNPIRRTNLELLRTRYGDDLQAVYRGIALYSKDGVTFEQIIEKCEREWFTFGVHEKRLRARVTLMMVLHKQWDMSLVMEDVDKRNIQFPEYSPLSDTEMVVINSAIENHRKKGDSYRRIIDAWPNGREPLRRNGLRQGMSVKVVWPS
jgi:hypothetical protein